MRFKREHSKLTSALPNRACHAFPFILRGVHVTQPAWLDGGKLVDSDCALQKEVVEQAENVNSGQALQSDRATTDKAADKKKPNADYSGAISGLSARLELQKDMFPDAKVTTADQVAGNKPDLQDKIATSYVYNFNEGGELKQLLGQKESDAAESLQTADNQKAIYDSVLLLISLKVGLKATRPVP